MNPSLHDAVRAAYPLAVTISGNDINSLTVLDAEGNSINIIQEKITSELSGLEYAYVIQQCKLQAMTLLQATDWATLPDVTTGEIKLTNQTEFLIYRSAVRKLAINPIANPTFPTIPTEVWA